MFHRPAAAVVLERRCSCYIGSVLAQCILDRGTAIGGPTHVGKVRDAAGIGDESLVSLSTLAAV